MTGTSRCQRLYRPLLEGLEDRTLLSLYTVDRLTDTGDGSGGAGDLRYCVSQATDGDVINFAVQGTIMAAAPYGHPQAFEITHSISIQGPGQDVLTISGFAFHDGRIFTVDSGATVDISGLTIVRGFSNGITSDGRGGGILNRGTLRLSNMTFDRNGSDNGLGGGAIFNAGTLTVSNSTFSNNGTGDHGGAIYNYGSLTINGSLFTGDSAEFGAGFIASEGNDAFLELSNSTFSGNRSTGAANGLLAVAGRATIYGCTISGNLCDRGIFCDGKVSITNSTISGNTLPEGDVLIGNSGTLTVINSTIAGNTALVTSAIYNVSASNQDATVLLVNCTIANNTVTNLAHGTGQLYSAYFGGGTGHATIELRDTIVSGGGNKPNFLALNGAGNFLSDGHNLSSDDGGGFLTGPGDLTKTDPMLGPLQDNGGPTQTMALLPGSPAVDAGDNTGAPDFDQRGPGFPRIVGGTIDIGAFEAQIGPATHFALTAPAQVASGSPFDVTITALDAYGHTAVGYLGTVTFTSTDIDPAVVLPSDYAFSPDDQGIHTFVGGFTLITPGDQTLTSTDTASGITGSATVTVIPGSQAPPRRGVRNNLSPISSAAIVLADQLFASMISDEAGLLFAKCR